MNTQFPYPMNEMERLAYAEGERTLRDYEIDRKEWQLLKAQVEREFKELMESAGIDWMHRSDSARKYLATEDMNYMDALALVELCKENGIADVEIAQSIWSSVLSGEGCSVILVIKQA
jgi:hypothetical protein